MNQILNNLNSANKPHRQFVKIAALGENEEFSIGSTEVMKGRFGEFLLGHVHHKISGEEATVIIPNRYRTPLQTEEAQQLMKSGKLYFKVIREGADTNLLFIDPPTQETTEKKRGRKN